MRCVIDDIIRKLLLSLKFFKIKSFLDAHDGSRDVSVSVCRSDVSLMPQSPAVDDEVTLDLSMRRDATVDALLCLQSEPIDFSKKTLDSSAGSSGLSALAAAVSDESKTAHIEQSALDTLAVAAVDAGSSSGVSSLHASPVRSELGIDESARFVLRF
jgi:hypothetical protein